MDFINEIRFYRKLDDSVFVFLHVTWFFVFFFTDYRDVNPDGRVRHKSSEVDVVADVW